MVDLLVAAVGCAATWAAWLGPMAGTAEDFWRALFARTYSAELRVEKQTRALDIVGKAPARYAALLPPAWDLAGIHHARGHRWHPRHAGPAGATAQRGARRWSWRARLDGR